jgi:hypothetical protein
MQEPRITLLHRDGSDIGQQGWSMALIYIELQRGTDATYSDTRSAVRSNTALYKETYHDE